MQCVECGRVWDDLDGDGARWLCVEVWAPDDADYLCPGCQGDAR